MGNGNEFHKERATNFAWIHFGTGKKVYVLRCQDSWRQVLLGFSRPYPVWWIWANLFVNLSISLSLSIELELNLWFVNVVMGSVENFFPLSKEFKPIKIHVFLRLNTRIVNLNGQIGPEELGRFACNAYPPRAEPINGYYFLAFFFFVGTSRALRHSIIINVNSFTLVPRFCFGKKVFSFLVILLEEEASSRPCLSIHSNGGVSHWMLLSRVFFWWPSANGNVLHFRWRRRRK